MRCWRPVFSSLKTIVTYLLSFLFIFSFFNPTEAQTKGALLLPVSENGFWGYMDMEGNNPNGYEYEEAHNYYQGYAVVKSHGKYGFIDMENKFLVNAKFDFVGDFHNGRAVVMNKGKSGNLCGYLNTSGAFVVGLDYEDAKDFQDGKARVKIDGIWGLIDKQGNEIMAPMFEEFSEFNEGLAAVKMDGKWGYVDGNGEVLIDFHFEEARKFSASVAIVKFEGMYGTIDTTGNFVIEPRFARIGDYHEGLAAAVSIEDPSGPQGYLNIKGEWAIDPQFTIAFDFHGLARVKVNGQYGFISREGAYVLPPQFSRAKDFSEGKAAVWNSGSGEVRKVGGQDVELNSEVEPEVFSAGFGYINPKGEWVIKPEFSSAENFSNGFAIVHLGEYFDYVKIDGKLLSRLRLVSVQEDNLWGYENQRTHELIIDYQFIQADNFENEVATVWVEGKDGGKMCGVIDMKGKYLLKAKYSDIRTFKDGLAIVTVGGSEFKMGYIDESYKVIVKPQYQVANNYSEGLALVGKKVKGTIKFGFIDAKGKLVVKMKYDDGKDFSNGKAKVKKGKNWIEIDKEGSKLK